MAYRQRPDEVVSRSLDIAAAPAGRPPIVDAGHSSRTHALLAGASLGFGGDQLDAVRAVARFAMKDAHGCTGAECRHPDHAAHRAVMGELLDVLLPDGDR